jgi:hypothetical protein
MRLTFVDGPWADASLDIDVSEPRPSLLIDSDSSGAYVLRLEVVAVSAVYRWVPINPDACAFGEQASSQYLGTDCSGQLRPEDGHANRS